VLHVDQAAEKGLADTRISDSPKPRDDELGLLLTKRNSDNQRQIRNAADDLTFAIGRGFLLCLMNDTTCSCYKMNIKTND
jgi:hypothetical protein